MTKPEEIVTEALRTTVPGDLFSDNPEAGEAAILLIARTALAALRKAGMLAEWKNTLDGHRCSHYNQPLPPPSQEPP